MKDKELRKVLLERGIIKYGNKKELLSNVVPTIHFIQAIAEYLGLEFVHIHKCCLNSSEANVFCRKK